MKYLAFILLVLSLAVNPTRTYSWDADAAKFYPLAVGNRWVYAYYYTMWDSTYFGGYRISQIVSDTVIAGHKYFRFSSSISPCNDYIFERIDSASMNVYRRSASTGAEQLLDSLLSRINNTYFGKRNCMAMPNIPVRCQDTNTITLLGIQRRTKMLIADGAIFTSYRFAENIGMCGLFGSEGNSWSNSLTGCVLNGTVYGDTNTLTGISQIGNEVPSRFSLSQNYPNPFNPVTNFGFRIADFGLVRLTVFDALGRKVTSIVNQQLQPGTYEVSWDASAYPSGVYYYRLEAGKFTETKKMVLIK